MAAVTASKQYFEATVSSYKNGLGSLTDAYLAEADYHDNRIKAVKIENSIYASLAEIYYYTGLATVKEVRTLDKKYLK